MQIPSAIGLFGWQDRGYRLADREMNKQESLYVLNFSLLATHQVDAAYWHEWDVFGVPGGLPFFLVFNLVAVALLAVGLGSVAARRPRARTWALLCASIGGLTVILHAWFLVVDGEAFWTPLSIGLFIAIAGTSVAQALAARRMRQR